MNCPVPLHIALERLVHHDDDRLEHLLRFGVVGVDEPFAVEIESDFYKWPRIRSIQSHGGIDLPQRLQDLLIFKCFAILAPTMSDSDIGELTIPDVTAWVETTFLDAEASVLLAELRRHVTLGLSVTPSHCSAFRSTQITPNDEVGHD